MPFFDKIVIVGLGVIGGSMARAVSRRNLARTVAGIDTSEKELNAALDEGAITESAVFPEGVKDASIVIIATPVNVTMEVIKKIGPYLLPGTIVTDVASTKLQIVQLAEKFLPAGVHFTGGHPMSGSEKSGFENSDPYLFENAYYVLTSGKNSVPDSTERIKVLVKEIGAIPVEVSPGEHDSIVAVVSHLPHVSASALVNTLGDFANYEDAAPLAAGGFRDTTRVSSGNPEMWKEILFSNRGEVVKIINKFIGELQDYKLALKNNDTGAVLKKLQEARDIRSNIPSCSKRKWDELHEIKVNVPDLPGIIGNISGCLGEEGINISDIEIMRVREWEGGTIRLAFRTEGEKENAFNILRNRGINVKQK